MAESSREYAALPPGLQRGGASSHEGGTSGTEPRTPSAKVALEFLVHAPSTPPAGRDGNDQLRRSLEIAAAARRWLSTRGFSEPEMAEVEALMDEFNTQALEDLGADGVRARVRELAVGTTSVVEPPHRPRPPEILIRSSETDGVVRQESCCTGSPGRGRSIRRAGSPPPTPEHVRTGMFVTLHKNEGLSSPHRRFFRFDTDTHIVAWTKQEPRRRSSYDGAGGKYAKVVCAKADIPTVRQNRGLHENVRGRCLRLQTVTHGTLNLEMEQESDVNLWLDVIREAGVTAEALDDVSPQEDAHKQLDRSPGRSKVSWKDGARDGRDSSTASILTGVSIGDDDHEAPGYSVEEDSGESLNECLDEAHWKTARDAFHMIAKRNIDTLKSDFERIATDTVHKFLSLGPDAEISLLESLSLRSYKKGATIINQGDDGEEFFILLHGTCIVEMDSKYVRTVDAPNAFGETALVTASKRAGSVRAISDTVETAVLSKLVFDRLVRKPEYPDFWQRSSLKTKFSAAHQQRLGHTGEITGLFPQSNEVEVEFAGGEQLRFPTGALGLLPSANNQGSSEPEQDSIDPIFRYCDAPTNSETRTLGIMEDWMLRRPELRLQRIGDTRGRRVAVMRDINVARSYFQRVEEVYHIDQYALTTSTAYFGAAWTLGVILGFNWGSLMIGFLLVINSFFSERARHTRLHSEVKNRVHMNWHRSIERRSRQESPEWVNQILKVSWIQMGVEKHVSQLIKEQTNPMLEDISKGYPQVEELKLESLTLGQNPPQINNLHFENSDVFGEFRINAEARLDAPDCLAKIRVDLVKSPPFTVTIKDLNINTDFQLLVRLSSDNGLTLVGVKLRKKLGLDYAISTKLTKNLNSIGGFPVQKVLNEQIHESLWWMSDPCMLLLPWYPAANSCSPSFVAGSDMEASLFDKPVGQLQIRVKSAKNLPVGDWHAKSSDPYVQFCVEKSWPLRKFKSRMVKKNLNPIFEHVVTTSLRWNESQTGVLLFEVFDHNEVGADDRLGMAELPIKLLVKHYDGLSAQKKDISLRLRELKDAKDREASKQDPALLHLSMTYFPTYKSPRVPMAVSDQPEAGCVQGGVLQLEVVSVKNLWHDMEDLYAVITYGKELDETKTGKRDRNAWRDGAEHSNTRSAEYTPGTFTNDYYCSKTVHPADCLTDIPDDERSKHKRGHCPVKWRDMPVGFKAYHEICVENCCDGVQISIMQPNLGKDKCLAKFSASTVPELLRHMHLLEGNCCMNGVTKEEWVDLTLVTNLNKRSNASQSVISAVDKGVKGVGKGVSGVGKGVTKLGKGVAKEAQRLARSASGPLSPADHLIESDDEDGLDTFEDDAAERTSERPQVRLAMSFWACRMYSTQPIDEGAVRSPQNDWRPPNDGVLSVRLISASNLIAADDNGLSDPYANLSVGFQEQQSANGTKDRRSKVKSKTLDPHWDETFLFRVKKFSTDADNMITITIFDKDALSSDDFLGSVEVSLTDEFRGRWIDHEIDKHFVLSDPEQRCKPRDKRLADAVDQARRDKDWSGAPLGRVHLLLGFHPDLEAPRDRGVSVMTLADFGDDRQVGALTDYEMPPAWSPSTIRSSSSGRGSVRDSRDSRDAAR